MEKNIITLKESGKKIARLIGNRELDEKIIKSKMKSMKKCGMLVPALIVDAANLVPKFELSDLETGEEITSDNANDYVVLVDANHRYVAHQRLLKENANLNIEDQYAGEFYMIYALNDNVPVTEMLSEVNVATNPWKGAGYLSGALLLNDENDVPLLVEMNKLIKQGYSLSTASKILTFSPKINKAMLVRAMNGTIDEALSNTSGIDRGNRIKTAVLKHFDEKFFKTRLLIDWIISKYDAATDEEKANLVDKIVTFFSANILDEEAQDIMKSKGSRGSDTKEHITNEKLNKLFKQYEDQTSE